MSKQAPTLARVGSHSVRLDLAPAPRPDGSRGPYRWAIVKEELFPTILTDWRGQPAAVTMESSRYEHSSGMSEWRIFPREARTYDTDHAPGTFGAHLTDTARRRLGELAEPLVVEYLASPDYRANRHAAVQSALYRIAGDLRTDGRYLRAASSAMADGGEITDAERDAWHKVADQYESLQVAMDSARGAA